MTSVKGFTLVKVIDVGFGAPEARNMTVCIRFVLRKKCLFGQQFFLVGEDPIFGSWDPSAAIPMTWSEGHIWTVEQNIPIESKTQFKFILKGGSGETEWQPGPNRVLKLWITKGTIIIEEDWDSPELQKAIEELPETEFTQMLAKQEVKAMPKRRKTVMQDSVENSDDALLVPGLSVAEGPEARKAMIDDFIGNTEGLVLVPGLLSKSIYSATEPFEQDQRNAGAEVGAVVEDQSFSNDPVIETDSSKPEPSTGKFGKELKVMSGQGNVERGAVDIPLAAAILKNDIEWGLRTCLGYFAVLISIIGNFD
ncbi:uncharacterized protein LOC116255166 isoform X4 [Nymphaea colorata]|uniref:uncharacterized protein LOC116255166 isoform X4 n=1 Tax=Nymphaea colorata TaxID=210225 RepID=UPI00129E4C39|nr:uncharacterized protein LOC116255166 isoform X4 [Nymphaea colorata]XP_031486802.1 uncharacterized protein LOC116255166 isoform X4 [Nymphaea colorata]XP_031486803.1 uncharacterized protein LOC116255166 isoform X4 [Nymphaea colorata]XP_031486804.1 uncharacterized protein LOC116255166 isoform X4 [Nymphaea colorata]